MADLELEKCPVSGQTVLEEIANVVTHGIGLILSVVGFIALLVVSILNGSGLLIAGSIIYGVTLIALYCMSTIYHICRSVKVKRIFRILDHASIYLLIAGTYTPFTFGALKGPLGWSIFAVIWALAFAGIVYKMFRLKGSGILSTLSYILMGWLCVFAIIPLFHNLSLAQFIGLIGGGAFYTLGTIFFGINSLPYNHAIWHLFVMGGSICHYISIFSIAMNPF